MDALPPIPQPPKVLAWYRAYSGAMAVLYLVVFAAGLGVAFMHDRLAGAPDDPPATFWLAYGAFIAVLGLVLGGLFVASFFLPPRPWVWIYHLGLISIGLTSPCCMPVCIPLLIFWIKPETRVYFGRMP
jgi:hypothetical protein